MAGHPETEKTVRNWISDHCSVLQCPACHEIDFEVNEIMVCLIDPNHVPKTPAKVALPGQGPTFQFIPLGCKKCGYVMFFSAKAVGITV